jgi:hypothetical protein
MVTDIVPYQLLQSYFVFEVNKAGTKTLRGSGWWSVDSEDLSVYVVVWFAEARSKQGIFDSYPLQSQIQHIAHRLAVHTSILTQFTY